MTSAPSLLFSLSHRFVNITIFESGRDASAANKFSNQVILRALDEHVLSYHCLALYHPHAAGLTCPAVSIQPNQLPKMWQTSLVFIPLLPNSLLVLASFIVMQADTGLSGPEPV
jgi:hypothetical protein